MQPKPLRVILRAYGEEHICKYLPAGWHDQSASWIFDYKTFGFNLKYSTEKLRFIKEDADFVRRTIDLYGISAEIDFTVQHRRNDWTFADSFTGQVNLPAGYVNDRDFVEVDVYEGGLKRAYSQNQRTNYELPLNDADAMDIEVPEGMLLYENVSYKLINPIIYTIKPNSPSITTRRAWLNLSIESENSSLYSNNIAFETQESYLDEKGNIQFYPFLTTKKGIVKSISAKMKGKIIFDGFVNSSYPANLSSVFSFNLRIYATTNQIINIKTLPHGYFLSNNEVNIDFNIPIEYYENIDVSYGIEITSNDTENLAMKFLGNLNISFFGTVNTGAFSFKAFKAEKLADKLMKKIHAPATCQIPFLQQMEQQGMQLFLTSGDGIRGISEALVKTNFQEFQNNLACLFDIGTQVSNAANTYKIVEKPVILNPDKLLLDLGTVKNMQLKPVPDEWLANNILVGYEKQEYDYPLGRQDFACTLEYINGLKIPNQKMELVSKYRADYTGVHLLYYDYVNSDKTDSKSDNDIFWILAFLKNGKWQAIKGDSVTANGLEGGGYFNILLSPHRNLRRHKNYMKSILDRHEKVLKYTSSTETQTDIQSSYGGETIIEKEDENVTSGTVLFKPIVFEFEAVIRKNLSEIMGESPEGYVSFNFNGVVCKGFPIEIAGSYTDSSQKVTCVAHQNTSSIIQQLLFSKLMQRNNEIGLNANWPKIGDDTSVTVSAQFPVSSDLTVSVKYEASYDNGVTWEDDVMIGGIINFTIHVGETNANSQEIPNPFEYNKRRFTILSITPSESIEFKYVAGVQITIGDGENSEDSKDRYLFLSDIQNQTPQGVYLQGLQGWGAMPDPTDTEKPYCLDTKNPIYAKWRDPKDGRIYRLVLMPDAKWWFAQSYAYAENGWVYNGNEDYRAAYGGMYNLSIANSNTPNGWRMANNADFNTLISAVGGTDIAGRKLKSRLNTRDNGATSASNPTWMYYNDTTLGTDDYGFGIITSGERASYNGGYYSIGSVAYIMSLEANSCYYASSDDVIFSNGYHNNNAFSVRYIKQ